MIPSTQGRSARLVPPLHLFCFAALLGLPLAWGRAGPSGPAPSEATHQGKTVSQWTKLLHHPEAGVRKNAVDALATLGPKATSAVPGLVQSLRDDSTAVREAALAALGRMGPAAEAAVRTVQ